MRKKIVIANWKMHKTIAEAVSFFRALPSGFPTGESIEVWVAPPFTAISACVSTALETKLNIQVGAQNMHEAASGAFTGEVSGAMLIESGAKFCLLGHSERREFFHETDQKINAKIRRALEVGLTPVLCVGEKQVERASGNHMGVIELQLAAGLAGVDSSQLKDLVIAYEPVWAIGTGMTATPEIAQETHRLMREFIAKRWGESIANFLPIVYGGSVKSDNIKLLLNEPDIDGALIGGASLEANHFIEIITKAVKK